MVHSDNNASDWLTAFAGGIGEVDAGVIYLPNGKKCYLVVLIRDSMESDAVNARIIAGIGRVVYRGIAGFSAGDF